MSTLKGRIAKPAFAQPLVGQAKHLRQLVYRSFVCSENVVIFLHLFLTVCVESGGRSDFLSVSCHARMSHRCSFRRRLLHDQRGALLSLPENNGRIDTQEETYYLLLKLLSFLLIPVHHISLLLPPTQPCAPTFSNLVFTS